MDLSGKSFTPSHVHDNPLIFAGCALKTLKEKTARTTGTNDRENALSLDFMEQKGDLLIHDLYQNDTESSHDMRVVNTNAKYHSAKPPDNCLKVVERENRHFSPFVASVDILMGVEVTATLKRIASRLEIKWRQPYSRACGYVKSRIAITLVRTTHWRILCYRLPAHRISVQRPQ